jgi:PAS domain S-box-containing protein
MYSIAVMLIRTRVAPLPVRVLIVDDLRDDAELLVRTLAAGGFAVEWRQASDAEGFRAALDGTPWDVILCDYSMPRFSPERALEELAGRGLDIPLLVVSGAIDESTAVSLMRAGARDYVLKDNLTRLVPAVTRELRGALARHAARDAHHQLRRSEAFFRTVVEHASDVIAVTDMKGTILHIAPSIANVLGREAEPLIGTPFLDLIDVEDRPAAAEHLDRLQTGSEPRVTCEACFPHADGSDRVLECVATRFRAPAGGEAIAVNARDVTERRRQERALRETSARLGLLNAVARSTHFGATAEQIVSRTLEHLAAAFPGMQAAYSRVDENNFIVVEDLRGAPGPTPLGHSIDLSRAPDVLRTLRQGRVFAVSNVARDARVTGLKDDAAGMSVQASAGAPLLDLGTLKGALSLLTLDPHEWTPHELATLAETAVYLSLALNEEAAQRDRRAAESALRQSEAQLRQAQKMEAIGRLAGGVAHDFNNLLTAIIGYGDVVSEQLGDHPAARDVEQILEAGQRAAALTRQLLAFSRQQVLEPEVLDPNALITEMSKLLARLIGPDVDLRLELQRDAGAIRTDRSQFEQVLMNLAVNARDAMPEGGALKITTRCVTLGADAAGALQVVPGEHVRIEVCDSGTGMDSATMARIFEPFFTTKQKGQGTGLGLATVYGIVAQSGGGVEVDSAVSVGTTFRLFFPRIGDAAPIEAVPVSAQTEVVLMLEPDAAARTRARKILGRAKHRVIEAATIEQARAVAERQLIDVLLVSPALAGDAAALAAELRGRMPALRAATLPPFPFTPETLLARIETGGPAE